MKKRFIKLWLVLVLCVSILTGCAFTERDNARYLAQTVAKTNIGIEVTMEEMLNSFNSFGYKYITENKLSAEEAFQKTINDVINKKIVINHVDGLTEADAMPEKFDWRALQKTYDYLNEQMESYEKIVKKDMGIENETADDEEKAEEDTTYVDKKYENHFELVEKLDENGNVILGYDGKPIQELAFAKNKDDEEAFPTSKPKEFYFASIGAQPNAIELNKEIFEKAKTKLFSDLKKSAKSRGIKDLSNDNLLRVEIDRVYKIEQENAKLSYLSKNIFDEKVAKTDERLLAMKTDLYNFYKSQYNSEKAPFETSDEAKKAEQVKKYITSMADGEAIKFYQPQEADNSYFYVNQILLKFDDKILEILKQKKEDVKNGKITQSDYDEYLESQYSSITSFPKDPKTGKVDTNGSLKNAKEILDLIKGQVNTQSSYTQKAEKFREFVYMYNQDNGIMGKETGYVIPTESYKANDKMVPTFAEEARKLRGSDLDAKENLGDMSADLVKSEFGYHIVMYLGDVEEPAVVEASTDMNKVLEELCTTRMREDYNKTYLDYIYEKYSQRAEFSYDSYLQGILDTARQGIETKFFKNRYSSEVKKYK